MGVESIVNANILNAVVRKGFKLGFFAETLSAEKVITVDYPPVLILDPNGASEDVLLPAEADSEGLCFFIINDGDGSQALVVKEDGDSVTIVTITFPEMGFVFCDGVAWRGFTADVT